MSNKTLYVTAYIDVGIGEPHKTSTWRINQFQTLYNSISIHSDIVIFVCSNTIPLLSAIYNSNPRVKLILFDYSVDSWIYRECLPYSNKLPSNRNTIKDTFLFLCLNQMKIEFVYKALEKTNGQYTHYAWFDFNLPHVFKTPLLTSGLLKSMASFTSSSFLAIPGCIKEKILPSPHYVHWRFCGGVFIGDAASIVNFHTLYVKHFANILKSVDHLTWEVNIWAELEYVHGLHVDWYSADHNDSIIRFPTRLYARKFGGVKQTYNYPYMKDYNPSSAAFICVQTSNSTALPLLVTRYVNYTIVSGGRFVINDAQNIIRTKNIISVLSADLSHTISNVILGEDALGLTANLDARYVGLEDMRIFINPNTGGLEFMAASASYTVDGTIRIVHGVVNLRTCQVECGRLLQPPAHTNCEKNWIPIYVGRDLPNKDRQKWIYRWHPYEIGHLEGDLLVIERSTIVPNLLFERVRGSSVPVWSPYYGCYLCVVHYAERGETGLEYYHMLVKLAADTYDIVGWSTPFYFTRIGIQYCYGFAVLDKMADDAGEIYGFWFSENDGNPGFIKNYSNQFFFVEVGDRDA